MRQNERKPKQAQPPGPNYSSIPIPNTLLFFFCPLFLLTLSSTASSTTTTPAENYSISLGSALYVANPNKTWSSPGNSFSLGFLQIKPSAYTLSITYTYNSIPIWTAGGHSAIVGPDASFHFLPDGDLHLLAGSGTILWKSNTAGLGVSYAYLDDYGNFFLNNNTGSGTSTVWSSFDHPTDTLVPFQSFSGGQVLKSGPYSFYLDHNTMNMTLKWHNSVVYWTSALLHPHDSLNSATNFTASWLAIQTFGFVSLFDFAYADYAGSGDGNGDILRFLKLNSDGNLRVYVSTRGSRAVTVRWTAVTDQCLVFGYCGNYGICSYNDTGPICGCPSQNFNPVDPNDSRKGCKLKKEIRDCPGSAIMLQMDHTRFLTYPPESVNDVYFVGISACRGNCLSGSSCVASTTVADGSGQCYIKTSSFVSGYQSATIPSTSMVKVCGPVVPNPPPTKETRKDKKLKHWTIAVIVLGTFVVLVLLQGSLWWGFYRKGSKLRGSSAQYTLLEYASGAPVQFSYRELQRATRGFKDKLGAGGFGAVYKGVLTSKTIVAVKQLEGIEQLEKQFRMEVATMSSTHHLNLVRLIGFCCEGQHRLLVYEFMRNGSLDSFIFATERESDKLLSWEPRFNIALGTARGITYLHEECRECIVHCDLKPENILLDDNYNAIVSDYGLAKLINSRENINHTLPSFKGTSEYLAPERFANLAPAPKSDVYSYGMVLLEIVSGRRNFEVSKETEGKSFFVWAYEQFEKGNIRSIVDHKLANCEVDMDQVTRAIQVSFWCTQEQPSQRPMMGKVIQMLEGVVEIGMPPALKTSPVVCISETSLNISNSTRSLSAFTASSPGPLSSSSFRTPEAPSSLSAMNVERNTSSLI